MMQKVYFCVTKPYYDNAKKSKNFQLRRALAEILLNQYEKANEILAYLSPSCEPSTQYCIEKLTFLQVIGELYGHQTLTGLLKGVGIQSNQKNKKWKALSFRTLFDWIVGLSKEVFKEDYVSLLNKSDSTWSRENITVIGDESMFRLWLEDAQEHLDAYYRKSYSGQFHQSVWGYKVSMWGLMMQDRFYPLEIHVLKREEKCIEVAKQCFENLSIFLKKCGEGFAKPSLILSVDSGFNDTDFLAFVQSQGFLTISVPKDSHLLEWENKTMNFKALKEIFLQKEKRYLSKQQKAVSAKDELKLQTQLEIKPFVWRDKITYKMHQKQVSIIVFRLNGSKKITIAFCSDLNVKAKTIRRHWFARTSIEQFFRLMKHTLKIQESKACNPKEFIKKLSLIIFKAGFILQLRNRVRKNVKGMKKATWCDIKRKLALELGRQWLEDQCKNTTFCIQIFP